MPDVLVLDYEYHMFICCVFRVGSGEEENTPEMNGSLQPGLTESINGHSGGDHHTHLGQLAGHPFPGSYHLSLFLTK